MNSKTYIKTGVFSGSFNPIHIGHLALANYLCEYENLDEIWFMVTPQNPFKQQVDLWDESLRLKLVTLAIKDYPRFKASDFEFHLPRPSYSVHTLEKLRLAFPDRKFHLIIGSDNWLTFEHWYRPEQIIKENAIIVYPRPGYPIPEKTNTHTNVRFVHSPILEISSTFIRKALEEGKDIRYFLHPAVWDFLQKHTTKISQNLTTDF